MARSITRNRLVLPAAAALVLCAPFAGAVNVSSGNSHADVMPYQSGGTISTGYYDFDLQQVVEETRVFVREMELVFSALYGTQNPGFTTFAGYTLPASEDLAFSVPTIEGADQVERNLLYWDGEGAPDFGAVSAGDFFRLSLTGRSTDLDGSGAPANGFNIETTNPDGEMHNHVSFSARGAGGTQPADGFYLFAMQLQIAGLTASEPFYMLFNADYERGEQGQVLYDGDRPIVDKASEQLATDWVIDSFFALPGDTDGDGDIDDADLGTAFSNFTGPVGAAGGKTAAQGDTDGDGDIDDADLANTFSGFTGPMAPAAVPEPGGVVLLLAAAGLFAGRSRRDRCETTPI